MKKLLRNAGFENCEYMDSLEEYNKIKSILEKKLKEKGYICYNNNEFKGDGDKQTTWDDIIDSIGFTISECEGKYFEDIDDTELNIIIDNTIKTFAGINKTDSFDTFKSLT